MAKVLEIVQFRVPAERTDAFLASRRRAIRAIAEKFGGLIRVELGHLGEDRWVDVALWESLDQAQRASAEAMTVPEFEQMGRLISEELGMQHAAVRDTLVGSRG